jgi:hypothetical protein
MKEVGTITFIAASYCKNEELKISKCALYTNKLSIILDSSFKKYNEYICTSWERYFKYIAKSRKAITFAR